MMPFKGEQATFAYIQHHPFTADQVFPLLCPVREKEWLDGWDYAMIHSHSGLVEMNCVFSTPYRDGIRTIWLTTEYDRNDHIVEFVRHTPGEHIVKINLKVSNNPDGKGCQTFVVYQYTGLNEHQNAYIQGDLHIHFMQSVQWWERAINHFLQTGTMLMR